MSYIRVYVHYIWSTKNRMPLLTKEIRDKVFQHIRENAKKKNIFLDHINGYVDHVHCLISMNAELSIQEVARLLKGESSHWVNKNKITKTEFAWQDEYMAVGVGDDKLDIVRKYIANQETHHKKISFQEEYQKFIKRYGFDVSGKDS